MTITYAVEQLDTVALSAASTIDGMDLMSPFVWREGDLYRIMVRGVPHPLARTTRPGSSRAGKVAMD